MTLYELNKVQYSKLPKMIKSEKAKAIETIISFLLRDPNSYYAMLNYNDTHYFTVFVWKESTAEDFAKEVLATAESIGEVKAVELNNEFIELWVKPKGKECNMYGFFKYDKGVIVV